MLLSILAATNYATFIGTFAIAFLFSFWIYCSNLRVRYHQSVRENVTYSSSPGGLATNSYKGHTFWLVNLYSDAIMTYLYYDWLFIPSFFTTHMYSIAKDIFGLEQLQRFSILGTSRLGSFPHGIYFTQVQSTATNFEFCSATIVGNAPLQFGNPPYFFLLENSLHIKYLILFFPIYLQANLQL